MYSISAISAGSKFKGEKKLTITFNRNNKSSKLHNETVFLTNTTNHRLTGKLITVSRAFLTPTLTYLQVNWGYLLSVCMSGISFYASNSVTVGWPPASLLNAQTTNALV